MAVENNEIKIILEEQRKEYQNYLGVLAEDFKGEVELLAEQVEANTKKLTEHDKRFDRMEKDISGIREAVAVTRVDIAVLKTAAKITQNSIDAVKADTTFLKADSMQKVSREEFSTLEKRVILLENKFSHA